MAAIATAAAGATALAAWVDARFHIRHDMSKSSLAKTKDEAQKYLEQQAMKKKLLTYHIIEEQAEARPNHLFLVFEGRTWTYKQFYDDLQRVCSL